MLCSLIDSASVSEEAVPPSSWYLPMDLLRHIRIRIHMNPFEGFKFSFWSFLQSLEIMSRPSGKTNVRCLITEELRRGIFRYKTVDVTQAWGCMRRALRKISSW